MSPVVSPSAASVLTAVLRLHWVLVWSLVMTTVLGGHHPGTLVGCPVMLTVYGGQRPGFLEGYRQLKEAITPWGA